MRQWMLLSSFVFGSLALASAPNLPPVGKGTELLADIRDKLSPIVEATLQKNCGDDCPTFRIEPRLKTEHADEVDDLGFSGGADLSEAPELKSVQLNLLIHESIPAAQRQSLKEILRYRLANEVDVPVSVQVKTLKVPAPLLAGPTKEAIAASPVLALVNALSWPVCLLLLGCLGVIAVLMVLRHRRALLAPAEAVAAETAVTDSVSPAASEQSEALTALLAQRATDLAWWLEERAALKDVETLGRVLAMFPASELSASLPLSGQLTHELAALSHGATKKETNETDLTWIEAALDGAHWRHKNEEKNPSTRFARFSDDKVLGLYSQLTSGNDKAALVCSLRQDQWPALLSRLDADERVRLGLEISAYEKAPLPQRVALDSSLALTVAKVEGLFDGTQSLPKSLVEDFTLYLSEKEGRALWQKLSTSPQAQAKVLSSDAVFEKLDREALVEICMRLDVQNLKALVRSASPTVRDRVLSVLPQTLRARLGSEARGEVASNGDAPPELIKARAELLGIYRQFRSEGMVQ